MSAAIILNGVALVMLITLRSHSPTAAGKPDGGVISVSVAATPRTEKQSPLMTPLFRMRAQAAALSTDAAVAVTSPLGASDDCPIVEDVAKGILADPAALDAVIHSPAELRSVADAIVIWNSKWTPAAAPASGATQSPLGPVRTNVTATLQTLPATCLSEVVSGPRLVAVPNGDRTLILVFGSGDWSWKTLIEPDPAEDVPVLGQGMAANIAPQPNRITRQTSGAQFSYPPRRASQYR